MALTAAASELGLAFMGKKAELLAQAMTFANAMTNSAALVIAGFCHELDQKKSEGREFIPALANLW